MREQFDLKALYLALDDERSARSMTWAAVTREINGQFEDVATSRPIATSTITGIRGKSHVEGDGILQMLLWLDRPPESFVPGMAWDAEKARLPRPDAAHILRWDTLAIYAAMETARQARGMSWLEVAHEIGGFTAPMLTRMSKGGRTGLPRVMRIIGWLGQPAATFTRASDR